MAPRVVSRQKRDLKHWAVVLLGGIGLASIGIIILEWDGGTRPNESELVLERNSPTPAPEVRRDSMLASPEPSRAVASVPRPQAQLTESNLPVGADAAKEAERYRAAMALLEKGEDLKARRKWQEAAAVYERIVREYPVIHDPDQEFIEVHMTEELGPEIAYFRCLKDAPAAPTFDSVDSLARSLQAHVRNGEIGRLERMLDRCGMLVGEGLEVEAVSGDALEATRQIIGVIERNHAEMDWSDAEVSRFGIEVPSRKSDASYYFVFQSSDDRWTWAGFRKIQNQNAGRSAASTR